VSNTDSNIPQVILLAEPFCTYSRIFDNSVRVMSKILFSFIYFVFLISLGNSKSIQLIPDGDSENTYDLLNSILGGTAYETPDCAHKSFGHHITQIKDAELQKPAFAFHIHVTPDNDGCSKFDRQRNEIKTYGPSPKYLKGYLDESVSFKWTFKLDKNFKPSKSFTHIHQIKAGDGEAGSPIMTITPRKGSGVAKNSNVSYLQVLI